MRSFPTAFATELAKKTGITPIWILRLVVDGTTYNISDTSYTFPVDTLDGFTGTTLPWVAQWGEVRESISGAIGEMLVSDFSVTLLVDEDDSSNIKDLALGHPLETAPAELYLWLDGLDSTAVAPQLMFRGYVKDIDIPDATQVHLVIEDESNRLQKYLGTRITSEAYPLCDPDDVGKLIPIVYGSVSKLPARCVDSGWVSSIIADLDATATTVTVSEVPSNYSLQYKVAFIDDEQIFIQSVAGKVLTITRGYDSTPVGVHTKGSTVVEKKSTPLVYLLADHALDSIGTIMARVRDIDVDITADCTTYLGTVGNQLTAYPGKAAITIPDFAKVLQKINLTINDQIKVTDLPHSHTTGSTVNTKTSNTTTSPLPSNARAYPGTIPAHTYGSGYMSMCNCVFPNEGTIFESTLAITLAVSTTDWAIILADKPNIDRFIDGANTYVLYTQARSGTFSLSLPIPSATAMQYRYVHIAVLVPANPSSYDNTYPLGLGPTTISAISMSIRSSTSGVATTQSAANVSKQGTVTLNGNSVADIMVGDLILADVTRSLTAPFDVLDDLLSTYCNDTTLALVGTMPAGYAFNGAITEYKKAIEWIDYLAFQCQSYFRKIGGTSKLIVRETDPASDGTIPACCLTSDGIRDISYKKAPLSDVINVVNVLYDRDWTNSGRQAESYRHAIESRDEASITAYDEQERPDMFMFDFVTDSSHANALASFYADFYADRKWRVSFSAYLDQAAWQFGDIATAPFINDLVGQIVEAGISPGSADQIDKMKFILEAVVVPVLDEFALTTLLGDQLMTKDRERIVYV